MDYSNCSLEELVLDDYFRKWVSGELPDEDTFWTRWQETHPEKQEMIDQAIYVLKALDMTHEKIGAQRLSEKIRQIMDAAAPEEAAEKPFRSVWKFAAAIVLLSGLTWYFARTGEVAPSYPVTVADEAGRMIEKINNSTQPLTLSLSDGSLITLQPDSRLRYPAVFATDKREVMLSGEAFFDISHNRGQPFLVYANEIVTRVLGTSFTIKAYETGADVTVKVVTGKVSVQTVRPSLHSSVQSEGLILTPNQMAVYARTPEKLTRTLIDNPGIVKTSNKRSSDFNFQDTPVAQVFQVLEEGYGIPIIYNAELLAGCTITAPLENETLYEKLDMICKVIRASYEVVDAQVIITSRGCNQL